ncbi:MAG: hypothetical protein ACRCVE_05125 [Plesiomonas sp.]
MTVESDLLKMYAQINRQRTSLAMVNKEFVQIIDMIKQLEISAKNSDGDLARERLYQLNQQFPNGLSEQYHILESKAKKIERSIKQMESIILSIKCER